MKANILVIDDTQEIRSSLELFLGYEGFKVRSASNGDQGIAALAKQEADVILLDIKMPGKDGLELLPILQEKYPESSVIMISGHGDIKSAVEAVKLGAFDFLEKPLEEERVLVSIRNCLRQRSLAKENRTLHAQLQKDYQLLGNAPAMDKVREAMQKVAGSDTRVLITGENGTGKELVGRQIHLLGPRHNQPFVAVNCAAIPRDLIESELFGHEKGAFTDALQRRIGQFEAASQGTLFLDEIGDMDIAAQAKVLRAIEQNEIVRVGGSEQVKVYPRIIAATNKDLQTAVEVKQFRMDLYYRLSVVPIHLPALREHREDIPLLAGYFLSSAVKKMQTRSKTLSAEANSFLMRQEWPGNVRELKNFMERAAILLEVEEIHAKHLAQIVDQKPPKELEELFACETFEHFKDSAEAAFLRRKLQENAWNIKKTAETLKMQRSNLYKKLEKYNLK